MSSSFATALDQLPKVELHCHIEGTMRATTLIELANRQGTELPATNPTELYRYDSLDGFLKVFWLVQSTLATRDDWARLAYESVIDGAAHGLIRESPGQQAPCNKTPGLRDANLAHMIGVRKEERTWGKSALGFQSRSTGS